MARLCYKITPGTTISLESDGRYRIDTPSGHTARLHPPAITPALMLDGRRSEEEIERAMAAEGSPMPPGVLGEIFRSLVAAGALEENETEWRPIQAMPWPEHACHGCGACCQGHWIGPLKPGFVTETTGRMEALRESYPALRGKRPFVRIFEGNSALFLNSESGQCLFLDQDLKCILHKEYGAEGKPHICRMFPMVRFEDDAVTRLGVSLMCLTHFDQTLAEEEPAPASHWMEVNDEIDGWLHHYYPPTNQAQLEEDIVTSLANVDDPLGELFEAVTPRGGRKKGKKEAPRRLSRLAALYFLRLDDVLKEEPMMTGLLEQDGRFPETARAIRAFAEQLGDKKVRLLPPPRRLRTPEIKRLLQDAIRRFLFLRHYLMFNGLRHGAAALGVGVWVAFHLSMNHERPAHRFGEVLATWMRMIQSADARLALFQSPDEVVVFVRTFLQYWRK